VTVFFVISISSGTEFSDDWDPSHPIDISNGQEFYGQCLPCQLPAAHTRAIKECLRSGNSNNLNTTNIPL